MAGSSKIVDQSFAWYSSFYGTIKQMPINIALVIVSTIVFYKVVRLSRRLHRGQDPREPAKANGGQRKLPPLLKDFTIPELREYDGTREDGRILLAVNFNVYDVSRSMHYYGRGGVYPSYAGRDISRNLIHFSVESNESEEYDDLCDLSTSQMNTLREWDQQYKEKYPFVGKLLRPGEVHTNYDDEEDSE
ncbi:probable steroid-binding protein 3 [Drosophila rhopaloa]|uniref:Probable steroid-binding protein 3 n=1 Tax=Drosophila rhopaloa TaxID=1041015 RepID=A0A6P4FLD3_DRORH|nr:probable steroid-binding protein 3 [Drosophila rhopaloa]